MEHRGDEHHLFPKAYLSAAGYKKSEYNQVANYVFTEQQSNIRLSDKAPDEYFKLIKEDIETGNKHYTSLASLDALQKNLTENCIPENYQDFNSDSYPKFLSDRRKLMAEKIHSFYDSL